MAVCMALFVFREIKLSLWAALKDVVPYAGIALLAIAAAYFITGHITDIYLLILTKITVTAILYGGLMWICGSETFKESLSYLLKKTGKNKISLSIFITFADRNYK